VKVHPGPQSSIEPSLGRQILDRRRRSILEVVEHLGGMNAQSPRGPSVGLYSRIDGFHQNDLDGLLRRYELVKANLMRGTIHMVTARQYRSWRVALQPALERTVKQFFPGIWKRVDHSDVLAAGTALLAEDHDNGLTRAEIGRRLALQFPTAGADELGFAIRLLAPVIQVADQTAWNPRRTRYVLASSVLGDVLGDPSDGLMDLLLTYLRSSGPASAADATYFTGITALAAPLRAVGRPIPGSDPRAPLFDVTDPDVGDVAPTVVLPEYDNVYFAHKLGPLAAARKRLIPNTATSMHGSLLVHGTVAAAWRKGPDGLPALTAWGPVPKDAQRHFDRFREWYRGTDGALV
jgi:hypothetical protein